MVKKGRKEVFNYTVQEFLKKLKSGVNSKKYEVIAAQIKHQNLQNSNPIYHDHPNQIQP